MKAIKAIHKISPYLLEAVPEDARYIDSPFRELRKLCPKTKGARMAKITDEVLRLAFPGIIIEKATHTDYDSIIIGKNAEKKGSCLGMDKDKFSFLQIRPDQDFSIIYFSCFYPHRIDILTMTRKIMMRNIEKGIFKKQHLGEKGTSGTYIYYGNTETLLDIGAELILTVT